MTRQWTRAQHEAVAALEWLQDATGRRALHSGAASEFYPETEPSRYVVTDSRALIRDATSLRSLDAEIALGTPVEVLRTRAVGNRVFAEVRILGGQAAHWTAMSNLRAVSSPIARAAIQESALAAVSAALVTVAPVSLREHAQQSIPIIVRQAAELGVRNAHQVAYLLATAEHESKLGRDMVEKRNAFRRNATTGQYQATNHVTGRRVTAGSLDALETLYWDDAYGGRLGNVTGTTDARNFRGRGYVQLTGRNNYRIMTGVLIAQDFRYTQGGVQYGGAGGPAIDLVSNWGHVNQVPVLAARLLVEGSISGFYTTRRLDRYINSSGVDFVNARRVINGDVGTNGAAIAAMARRYDAVLVRGNAWSAVFIG